MMRFTKHTLEEIGFVGRGRSKHRPRDDKRLYGGQYPFIQTADVKNAPLYITKYSQSYNNFGLTQSKLWDSGTLCITIAANIADTAILTFPACFPDSILGFIPHPDKADVKYIKYCFDILQRNFQNISHGATQDNLSIDKLLTIKLSIPSLQIQHRIADILSAYDDLIENNRKQIALLEEAAQRLYKEWFVDFRFPGHETAEWENGLPKGWKKRTFDEVCEFVRGRSYSSAELVECGGTPMVNLKNIRAWGGYNRCAEKGFNGKYTQQQSLVAGDVVMAVTDMTQERRLVGHVARIPDMGCIATFSMDLIKLIPKLATSNYIYLLLMYSNLSTEIAQVATGVNVLHLKPENIKKMGMVIPDSSITAHLDKIITTIFHKTDFLETQNIKLAKTRDSLLPKLMSGEIEGKGE